MCVCRQMALPLCTRQIHQVKHSMSDIALCMSMGELVSTIVCSSQHDWSHIFPSYLAYAMCFAHHKDLVRNLDTEDF